MNDSLNFFDNQGRQHTLDKNLVKQQDLSTEQIEKIKKLHIKLYDIFDSIKDETDKNQLHIVVLEIQKIEYELQANWGFDLNPDYHSWWFKTPGCNCPKMDNYERHGFGKIVSANCPLHGSKK